jgi:hypothetical protein
VGSIWDASFGKKEWAQWRFFLSAMRAGGVSGTGWEQSLGFGTDMEPDSPSDAWGNRRVPTAGRTGSIVATRIIDRENREAKVK